nr:nuclease [uncultured Brevundimonas sp.]
MSRSRRRRPRLPSPPTKRPHRRSHPWRFAVAVAGVAAAAFLTVVYWPLDDDVERLIPKVEQMLAVEPDPEPETGSAAAIADRFACDVAYVNDGDTFRCQDGTRIRLHAVAARETDETCSPGHPCPTASAASATAELRRLAANRTITCERIGQSYNRVTAICWTPADVEINCAMIRSGKTVVWDRFNRERPICQS